MFFETSKNIKPKEAQQKPRRINETKKVQK